MSRSLSIDLRPPKGPVAEKYSRFVLDGEPDGSLGPGFKSIGKHQGIYMAGDFGTAKSNALVAKIVMKALLYPGIHIGLFRARLQDLKRSTWPILEEYLRGNSASYEFEEFDMGARTKNIHKLNKQDWICVVKGMRDEDGREYPDSIIYMFGLDTGDPIAKLKSVEFGLIAIDEANEVTEDVVDAAFGRIRQKVYHISTGDMNFGQVALVSNRDGGEDHWIHQKFITDAVEVKPDHYQKHFMWEDKEGNTRHAYTLAMETFYWENKSLNENVLDAVAIMNPETRERFFGGVWAKNMGRVFPMFGRHNIIEEQRIPEDWPIYVGIDHGLNHPTAAVFLAHDPYNDKVYQFDEYVATGGTPTGHAITILSKFGSRKNPVEWYGDSSMWQSVGDSSVAELYMSAGIPLTPSTRTASLRDPRNRDADVGINLIREMFEGRGQLGGSSEPKMYVMDNCKESIRQYRTIEWEELAQLKNDDIVKALRYAVVMMPTGNYRFGKDPKYKPNRTVAR